MSSTCQEIDANFHDGDDNDPPSTPSSYYFASHHGGRRIDVETSGMKYVSSVSTSSNSSGHSSNASVEVVEKIPNGVYNGECYSRPVNVSIACKSTLCLYGRIRS